MREHVAELAVGQAGATMSADDRKKHLANLGVASGEQYVDHCVKERSEKYVECALAAATLEELAKCGQRP